MYSMSASLSSAAPECRTGTETLVRTLPMMAASRRVHVWLCDDEHDIQRVIDRAGGGKLTSHSGNKMPLKKAAGL